MIVLPFANKIIQCSPKKIQPKSGFSIPLLSGLAIISLCSTSIKGYCDTPEGTVYIGQEYKLKVPQDTVLQRIKNLGFEYEKVQHNSQNGGTYEEYVIKNVVVPINEKNYCGQNDTIQKLTFHFQNFYGENKLFIDEVTFSDTLHISNWKTMKHYSKMYNKITKDLFAKEAVKK